MSVAISVHNVSKLYRLGEISRGQLLADIHRWWMKRMARKTRQGDSPTEDAPEEKGDFWALKDISFEIKQGETIAIVGANGAGKSTLLKIISRITAPTTGLVRITGRVGSLLEVGTGFHPQLTGRDNVYLNGAILGMSRNEVKNKFDQIVDFSGLEQFIDTPVKRYSSGMYVRLAFSVAAFLEPEILIIDEVLSVGDQQFQNRCMQRMEQIINDGRTLLFVSHGTGVVRQVCRKAICLQHGTMIFNGDVNEAVAVYEESTKQEAAIALEQASMKANSLKEWPSLDIAPGDEVVKLQAVRIVNSHGGAVENVSTTQSSAVEVEFVVLQNGRYLRPSLMLIDGLGNTLFWSADTNPELLRTPMEKGKYKSSMLIPADFLAPGPIFIHVGIASDLRNHAFAADVLTFNVIDDFSEDSVRCGYNGAIPGFLRPRMKWVTKPNN
jgi:lipopolysaccharide transport system ATP-binding protein